MIRVERVTPAPLQARLCDVDDCFEKATYRLIIDTSDIGRRGGIQPYLCQDCVLLLAIDIEDKAPSP